MDAYIKLKQFIEGLNLISPNKINLETRIEEDLGITGDDAIDFITEFGNHFNIIIDDFDYDKYFKSESAPFFFGVFASRKKEQRIELTVEDLLNAISKGYLE